MDDRPWGGPSPPAVAYVFADGRGAEEIAGQLSGFSGPPTVAENLPVTSVSPRMREISPRHNDIWPAFLLGWRLSDIPDQYPAPVRVEERKGRVSKSTDRDGAVNASERDFFAWREPIVGHIDELTDSDFAAVTNHSRIRERLLALRKLLQGEIAEISEKQFVIGYEIERFNGLMAAYRLNGEDTPNLNAVQFEDLEKLRIALNKGISKFARWRKFYSQANDLTINGLNPLPIINALDRMATVMEQDEKYFDPELPRSFRYLMEAVRDPWGATKTILYGAVKSIENLITFLARRSVAIGKNTIEAIETHISKAVAGALLITLGTAAGGLAIELPPTFTWLKLLLLKLLTFGN